MRFASLAAISVLVISGAIACSSSTGSTSSSTSSSSGSSGTTSGSSGTSGCVDYSPPAGFDATTPTVSFATDVVPIFGMSCGLSVSCHGATTGNANGVFLNKTDPAKIYANIVSKAGDELPSMDFVTPGDPRNSYLMRKMDASQCALDSQCTGGTCESSMPQNLDSLPVETRDVVRRWIAQGAQNN